MHAAYAPGIKRGPLMRYKTLWEGTNQAQVGGLLQWERVLRAQGQPEVGKKEPVFQKTNLVEEPPNDDDLDDLNAQFNRLTTGIRVALTEEASAAVSAEVLAASAPGGVGENMEAQFVGLRDQLRGHAPPAKDPDVVPIMQPQPGSSRPAALTIGRGGGDESPQARLPLPPGSPPPNFAQHAAAISASGFVSHIATSAAPAAQPACWDVAPPCAFRTNSVDYTQVVAHQRQTSAATEEEEELVATGGYDGGDVGVSVDERTKMAVVGAVFGQRGSKAPAAAAAVPPRSSQQPPPPPAGANLVPPPPLPPGLVRRASAEVEAEAAADARRRRLLLGEAADVDTDASLVETRPRTASSGYTRGAAALAARPEGWLDAQLAQRGDEHADEDARLEALRQYAAQTLQEHEPYRPMRPAGATANVAAANPAPMTWSTAPPAPAASSAELQSALRSNKAMYAASRSQIRGGSGGSGGGRKSSKGGGGKREEVHEAQHAIRRLRRGSTQ